MHVFQLFQASKKKLFRRGPGNSLQLLSVPFSVLREHVEEEVCLCNWTVIYFFLTALSGFIILYTVQNYVKTFYKRNKK